MYSAVRLSASWSLHDRLQPAAARLSEGVDSLQSGPF